MSTRTLTFTEYYRLNQDAERMRAAELQAAAAERRLAETKRNVEELQRRLEEERKKPRRQSATVGMLASENESLRNRLNQANARLNEIQNMGELHEQHVRELNQELERVHRANREARDRDGAFRNCVQNQFGEMEMRMNRIMQRLEGQRGQITALVGQIRQEREEMIQRIGNERERVVQTIEELRRYLDELKPMEIERFYPGLYASLERMADIAARNIDSGDMQAALAMTQYGCVEASTLYMRTRIQFEAFEERVEEARIIASHAREVLDRSEETIAAEIARRLEELENGCPEEAKRPGYWNGGAFGALRSRLERISEELENIRDNRWTTDELNERIQDLIDIENDTLEAEQEAQLELARYFDNMVNGIETILEVLGDGWECIRYEHTVPNNLKTPVQMVFVDGAGHELPMILDIRADEPEVARLDMAVVGSGIEERGEDAQVTLDDITGRLREHGLRIGVCETDLSNCDTVARTADAYFEERRRQAQTEQ